MSRENLITKHGSMSDKEFLTFIQNKLGHSWVIDALVERLEKHIDVNAPAYDSKLLCPVCESSLELIIDDRNEMFILTQGEKIV
jgi:hypothetical protein